MAKITLSYDPKSQLGIFTRDDGLPQSVWIRVRSAAIDADEHARVTSHRIELAWAMALTVLRTLAPLQQQLKFIFDADETSKELIEKFQSDVEAVRKGGGAVQGAMSAGAIEAALHKNDWKPERPLKPYQLENLVRLVGLANGANFSVPGAGKTTVTFALHLLTQAQADVLMVVAPRNAFPAWESVVDECLMPGSSPRHEQFTALIGGEARIKAALSSGAYRFIISYDQLVRVDGLLDDFMARNKTHLVLDESHRMKAGAAAQRGAALLRMSHLPVRRDILSGTPMPQSSLDIQSQLDFLWPGTGLGSRISRGEAPRQVLGDLYVRTTKSNLGLPRRDRIAVPVRLSDAHLALYSVMKDDFFARYSALRHGKHAVELIRARRSVMRLLRAAIDPRTFARVLREVEAKDEVQGLVQAALAEGPSQRVLAAAELATKLAAEGKKVLIWTIFRSTLDQLEGLLKPLKPAVLHGGISLGDEAVDETRQGQIRRFKQDPECMVMLANPAAASEGISLHMACHDAIYVDRSYNAVHFLQSIDRIHRLGLPQDTVTTVYVLQNQLPKGVGSIDRSVARRLSVKIQNMRDLLDDQDLHELALDEDNDIQAMEDLVDERDVADLLDEIEGRTVQEAGDEA